jgi:hypothetical protein
MKAGRGDGHKEHRELKNNGERVLNLCFLCVPWAAPFSKFGQFGQFGNLVMPPSPSAQHPNITK